MAAVDLKSSPRHPDLDDLMARYGRTRWPGLREPIVLACTPVIKWMALAFAAKGFPYDDLFQVGCLGLLTAIETFDPARGARFETYARRMIHGEMRHYLRDHHNVVRRPRWLDKMNHQIESAVARSLDTRGRFPTLEELAAELNVVEEGLVEVLKAREMFRQNPLQTDPEAGPVEIDRRRIRHKTYESFQLPIEDRIVLMEAMEKLTTMQRRVIYYLFFRDLNQKITARLIGTSQRQVSRLLAAALGRLRELVGPTY